MNYDDHFTSADYAHKSGKKKHSNRRHLSKRNKKKEFAMVKRGEQPTFFIVDEKKLYRKYEGIREAYDEEIISWNRVRRVLYYKSDGTPVMYWSMEPYCTGTFIHHPAKKVMRSEFLGTVPCEPYIKHYSLSGRKSYAKKMTNRRNRKNALDNYGGKRAGYQSNYDYAYEVW